MQAEVNSVLYDAVLCVAPHHNNVAIAAARSLRRLSQARHIYVVTNSGNFRLFEQERDRGLPIIPIDEDTLIEGVSLRGIEEYLARRCGSPARAGWYFQQFLKMSICRLPEAAEHYLIWDGDTVMLRPLEFFDRDGRVLVTPLVGHYHQPYFDLTQKLLGLPRQVDFSFISEHLMVSKVLMNRIIVSIEERNSKGEAWPYAILDLVEKEHLPGAGFSEYETYGSFMHAHEPDSYRTRSVESLRVAAALFGLTPNRYALYALSRKYAFATFEAWNVGPIQKRWLHSAFALLTYAHDYMRGRIIPETPRPSKRSADRPWG